MAENVKPLEERAAEFVKFYEGYAPVAVWDVNAYRIGHGSDTITFADGTFRKVVKGDATTKDNAQLDLARRIRLEFFPKVEKKIGSEAYKKLTDEAIIALVDIAYNYGSLTKKKIVEAAKSGDSKKLAEVIVSSTLNDNMGLEKANNWSKEKADKVRNALKARRKKEADLILSAQGNSQKSERRSNNVPPDAPDTTQHIDSGGESFGAGIPIVDKIAKVLCILFALYCVEEIIYMIVSGAQP